MTSLIKKEDALFLEESEINEINDYLSKGGKPLSSTAAASFLALFLEGRSVDQIHRAHSQWNKGAILYARYVCKWDEQKTAYLQDLTKQVAQRLAKSKVDSLSFLMDRLAIAHKEFADEMEVYLQNPTDDNLPKNRIQSMKDYRETVKTLQELMGLSQSNKDGPGGLQQMPVQINISTSGNTSVSLSPEEHADVLRKMRAGKIIDGEKK